MPQSYTINLIEILPTTIKCIKMIKIGSEPQLGQWIIADDSYFVIQQICHAPLLENLVIDVFAKRLGPYEQVHKAYHQWTSHR
jgi:hypothetical protein